MCTCTLYVQLSRVEEHGWNIIQEGFEIYNKTGSSDLFPVLNWDKKCMSTYVMLLFHFPINIQGVKNETVRFEMLISFGTNKLGLF